MKKVLSIILTAVMLCSIFALPAAADTETDNRVWFDLNGNVRLFVKSDEEAYKSRTTYKEYLPGGDFAGFVAAPTGDFATDQAAVKNPPFGGAMFLYKIGETPSSLSLYTTPEKCNQGCQFNY